MNKTYRVVFNRARGLATAVSEITSSNQARKKTLSSVVSTGLASMVLGFATQTAVASIPEGVSVSRNGASETITESDSATVSGVPLWTKTITDDGMHWRFNHKDPSLVDFKTQIEGTHPKRLSTLI